MLSGVGLVVLGQIFDVGAIVPDHVGVADRADAVHELQHPFLATAPGRLASETGSWARNGCCGASGVGLGADTGGRPAPVRQVNQAWNLLFQLRGVPEGGLGVIHGSLLDDLQQLFIR